MCFRKTTPVVLKFSWERRETQEREMGPAIVQAMDSRVQTSYIEEVMEEPWRSIR